MRWSWIAWGSHAYKHLAGWPPAASVTLNPYSTSFILHSFLTIPSHLLRISTADVSLILTSFFFCCLYCAENLQAVSEVVFISWKAILLMFQATLNESGDWTVFCRSMSCAHVRCETFRKVTWSWLG